MAWDLTLHDFSEWRKRKPNLTSPPLNCLFQGIPRGTLSRPGEWWHGGGGGCRAAPAPACVWAGHEGGKSGFGVCLPSGSAFLSSYLGRLPHSASLSLFPQLCCRDSNNSICFLKLLWGLKAILCLKNLALCLAGGRQLELTALVRAEDWGDYGVHPVEVAFLQGRTWS